MSTNCRLYVLEDLLMTKTQFATALTLALFATQASAATLLTMTGAVTFEDYGPNPSPFGTAADSVVISTIFDDTIPPNAEPVFGDVELAVYITAVLSTTVDIFNAGGDLLDSIDTPDPRLSLGYNPTTGASEVTLSSTFFPNPWSPFVELDVAFYGDNMLTGTALSQITEGRLEFADPGAQGSFETVNGTFDIDGIGFSIDPGSLSIKRDVAPPSPVPSPPAIFAMLTGILGLKFLARRGRSNRASRAGVGGSRLSSTPI